MNAILKHSISYKLHSLFLNGHGKEKAMLVSTGMYNEIEIAILLHFINRHEQKSFLYISNHF